jgi:hypothetical protein
MKTITVKEACQIIKESAAIVLPENDGRLIYPGLCEDEDDWLLLTWDDEGLDFNLRFDDKANPRIDDDGSLILTDDNGDDIKLQMLVTKKLT